MRISVEYLAFNGTKPKSYHHAQRFRALVDFSDLSPQSPYGEIVRRIQRAVRDDYFNVQKGVIPPGWTEDAVFDVPYEKVAPRALMLLQGTAA